jgi:hypothetical protein
MTAHEALRLRAEIGHAQANLARVALAISTREAALDETTTYALALLLMNYICNRLCKALCACS